MASFSPSDYIVASSLSEVVSILNTHGDKAKIIAGGTTIFELASRGMIPQVEVLLDVEKLGLSYIRESAEDTKIGATTTIAEAIRSEPFSLARVPYSLGAVAEALNAIHPDQVRNVATIGGEVCSGIPFLDLPPALIVLDAIAIAEGPQGTRSIPLARFYQDFFLTELGPKEMLTEIRIPKPTPRSGSAFRKFSRTGNDWAVINLATYISLDDSDKCQDCRIVVGAVGRSPIIMSRAASSLRTKRPDAETLERVAHAVLSELQPTSSLDATAPYKKELARVLSLEALSEATEAARRW